MNDEPKLPASHLPSHEDEYKVFGTDGPSIKIRVQYHGPVPDVGMPTRPEVFMYSIYHDDKHLYFGKLEWNPDNGVMTMQEVAKALALMWSTHHLLSF